MDKKKHYKVKIGSLIIAAIFVIIGFVLSHISYSKQTSKGELEKKYSGVVIGTIVSVCEDEDNEADCSIAIRYEVDGKEYILDIDDDDLIVKNYNEEVRYNPDNPSDAYSNSESVFYTSVEEKAWKYYTERFAKISFAIAVIAVFDAFVGYFIDNLFDQLNKTKEEIVDRTIDNDKKDKS